MPAITRKTEKGLPQYHDVEESDIFILSGAEDLVPVLVQVGGDWQRETIPPRTVDGKTYRIQRYRPRIEGLFARIERWTDQTDPSDSFWRSISKDNITTWYGKTSESRIFDPDDPQRIFSWLICDSYDDKGNVIVYGYKAEDSEKVDRSQAYERNRDDKARSANRYLKRIRYGNRTPYFPELLETAPMPAPPGAAAADGSANWHFEVVLDYGEHDTNIPAPDDGGKWSRRPDSFSVYRAGFEVRTYRLCQRALMFHNFPGEQGVEANCLVRSTDFTYTYEKDSTSARNPVYSRLLKVTQSGYKRLPEGGYLKKSLPPLEFGYTEPVVNDTVEEMDAESLENLPIGVDGSAYRWTDLHGEGIPGILTEQGGAWFYKRNLSPIPHKLSDGREMVKAQFAPLETVALKPNVALSSGAEFMDLAGDGQPDVVVMEGPTPGLYEHDGTEGWQPFRPFTSLLNRDTRDPNLKFVDLDGDGHADVLITEDDAFVWHPSLAEEGFGPARRVHQVLDEERGPRLVFADGAQSVYLADISGDGLTDLVRIRNGEVCYWPNLGYGRFGPKVTMDNAPWFDIPDQFDQKRVRLADIDGTGTTDIIYLHGEGVRLYFNQSGNSWGQPQFLRVFPRVDDVVSIVPTDLLGNGTACLVWSSPLPGDAGRQMRYVKLMGEQKPHLLIKTVNNLGAETRVYYAPSTKFYLQDKCDGRPWITRLPFPVHVVERVETYDHISRNRFVTRYTYHHGYFDGEEREFRGFGLVEQVDTEEYAALSQSGDFPVGDNVDKSSHVPPVLTKTWFHTGAYYNGKEISKHFEKEYYREGDVSLGESGLSGAQLDAMLLEDTILPDTLSPEGAREASRALKGSILRLEVYALDEKEASDRPYTVSERSYEVVEMQPRERNRHAVYFVHPRETIDFNYERKLYEVSGEKRADPRLTHNLTLEVDHQFGNVLKSAAIGYGRRYRDTDAQFAEGDHKKQEQILLTFTQNRYTNAILEIDDYRTPLPCESKTYEPINLKPDSTLPEVTNLFWFDELKRKIASAGDGRHDLNYEDNDHRDAVEDHPYRRLIEHVRTLYRKNDLTGLLPLGILESQALPGESYKLAFTPGLVGQVFDERASDAMLQNEGRYAQSEGDANWWVPSGRIFYSPDPADTLPQELAFARQHFFLSHRYRDPFHTNAVSTESFVTYDIYDLLMQEARDALGNRVTVGERNVDPTKPLVRHGHDYRILQPTLVMDPNRNRLAAAFDALGMVVGTAVMGKPLPEPAEGDSLDGFEADLTEAVALDNLANPMANPQAVLQRATTRLVYDFYTYYRTKDQPDPQPAVVYTQARETHHSDLSGGEETKIQHSFSYSDGFGREIQKKIQAEPGKVEEEDENGNVTTVDTAPNARWVGSGWTIFNNKGKPVRRYEPFFSTHHRFQFGKKVGVSPILFYDPLERVVATLHPNHTYEKVAFDPWQQTTYDVNDTVVAKDAETGDPRTDKDIAGYVAEYFKTKPSTWQTWHQERITGGKGAQEKTAAERAAKHANTLTIAHFDTLGRPFLTLAHNRFERDGTVVDEKYPTRAILDIEGNQREVIDAKDRIVMRYDYDMLGNRIHQASMEAGERWMLNDVAGNPIRAWDSRGFNRRMTYDSLRRPVELFVTEEGVERLAERTVYGEGQGDARNHKTRVYKVFDGAGVVTNEEYDFKGNLLGSKRELLSIYKQAVDWNQNPAPNGGTFITSTTYDALNRPMTATKPDGSIYRPVFNEANLLDKVDLNLRGEKDNGLPKWTPFVTNINYNAKGQRELIAYQNGAQTTYEYDPLTFRLIHLKTTRPPGLNGPTSQIFTDPTVVQDLRYTYDPVGNITRIEDVALRTVLRNNEEIKPICEYIYDAVYRLIESEGREHIAQTAFDFNPPDGERLDYPFLGLRANSNDLQALRKYIEQYEYDAVGNFGTMRHIAAGGSWTRSYEYNAVSLLEGSKKSNRLTKTSVGNGLNHTEDYTYADVQGIDVHGCITAINNMKMTWDFEDQLQRVDLGGGSAYYVYDAGGQRARKVIEAQNGTRQKERIYLGGFEVYREYENDGNTVKLERETLHIMDDKQRIALVETKTKENSTPINNPVPLRRFQLNNHLGSASVELDESGALISYEEYHPYGTTAFQADRSAAEVSLKRYRYTGKERDKESGFTYHGARYYASWFGRWMSCDPAGINDGVNLYKYAGGNPLTYADPKGTESEDQNYDLGPFRFSNFQLTGIENVRANFSLDLSGFFSGDRSIGVQSAFAAGTLRLRSELELPSFGLSGTGSYRLNLEGLRISNQVASAEISANARLEAAPFSLDLDLSAYGSTLLPERISLDNYREQLEQTVNDFRGWASVFGRLNVGGLAVGAFSLSADAREGAQGTLQFRGTFGFPSLDRGPATVLGRVSGTGSFAAGQYTLSGSFRAALPPLAFATGTWSLDPTHGLRIQGHYLGPQFGPIGLNAGINPTGNVTEDTPSLRAMDAMRTESGGVGGATSMFEPGPSLGYTYFRYGSSGSTLFNIGVSPTSSAVPYYRGGISQPLAGPSLGPYVGLRLRTSF